MSDWTQDAACFGWSWPDEFFAPRGLGTKQMKQLCKTCPVARDCFDWALKHERWGFWAGTNEEERDEYRKRLNITIDEPNAWQDRRPPEMKPCGTAAAGKAHQRKGEPVCEPCRAALNLAHRKAREARALRARKREIA
jgi:hypothetical protein